MSADSCHASVEREMKRGDVCDFDDFMNCIAATSSSVIQPRYDDFKAYEGQQSQSKLKKKDRPLLSDIRVAEFRRGSKMLFL